MRDIKEILLTLNDDQREMFKLLQNNTRHQFRVPTGVGKGYVMILHILWRLIKTRDTKVAIASHRLSLNNQHLKDLIDFFCELKLIGKVKFLTVGSMSLDINKVLQKDKVLARNFNNSLFDYNTTQDISSRLTVDRIFRSSLSTGEINQIVRDNDYNGFKTVIISTYNSLNKLKDIDLDIIYCDEAHILASEKEDSDFKKSYEIINTKRRFFFTATPKDVDKELIKEDESSEIFLMNNKDIFGDIYQVPFKKCIQKSYISTPIIHISLPSEILEDKNYDSIENKSKFVKDTFKSHKEWLKKNSNEPKTISPKILIRCESVPRMWDMHKVLTEVMPDVTICAGASYNKDKECNHAINNEWIKSRDEFVDKIQKIKDDEKVIILQYDIFSEGINVPGITGVMFLQGKMPTRAKIIQNVGRSTRLHKMDRSNIRKGLINNNDLSKWVKPYCAVILPYWDSRSEFTKDQLAFTIQDMRDRWGFDPRFEVSIGEDMAESELVYQDDGLNRLDRKNKKAYFIESILHKIEIIDKQTNESKKRALLNSLSPIELLKQNRISNYKNK
jgi:superfamily II DNA or RNA helicase